MTFKRTHKRFNALKKKRYRLNCLYLFSCLKIKVLKQKTNTLINCFKIKENDNTNN